MKNTIILSSKTISNNASLGHLQRSSLSLFKGLAFLAVALIAGTSISPVLALNESWNGSGGDSDWTNTANWGNATMPGATSGTTNSDKAIFANGVTNRTVLLDDNINIGSIFFQANDNDSEYTINADTGKALHLSSSLGNTIDTTQTSDVNYHEINAPIVLEPASSTSNGTHAFRSIGTNNRIKINGPISGGTTTGSVMLTIDGNSSGEIILNGDITDGGAAEGLGLNFVSGYRTSMNGTNTFTGGIIMNFTNNNAAIVMPTNNGINTHLGTGTITAINGFFFNGGGISDSQHNIITNNFILEKELRFTNAYWYELSGNVSLGKSGGDRIISNNGGTLTISGVISDGDIAPTIEFLGGGNLRLSSANTFSGGLIVSGKGALILGNDNALGTGTLFLNYDAFSGPNGVGTTFTGTSGIKISNDVVWNANMTITNTTLDFLGDVSLGDGTNSIRGISPNNGSTITFAGEISDGAVGTGIRKLEKGVVIFSGNNTYSGQTIIEEGEVRVGAGGSSGTLGAGDVINNASLTFNRTATLAVDSDISGSGKVTVRNTGTIILNGTNTYMGTTEISAGTLLVDGTHSDAGAYNVKDSGTFGGSGKITTLDADITLNITTHLSPGSLNTPGTLELDLGTGSLNISAAVGGVYVGALEFRLDPNVALSDRVELSGDYSYLKIGSGNLEFTDFAFTLTDSLSAGNYTWELFKTQNAIDGTLGTNLVGDIGGYSGAELTLSGDGQSILLNLTVIPEPGTVTLLLLALACGGTRFGLRRRIAKV